MMDSFTENILSRARERQRMIGEDIVPLQETNMNAVSEPNLSDIKRIPPKEFHSDTNLTANINKEEGAILGLLTPTKSQFTRRNSITRISSNIEGSNNNMQTKTLNIQRDDFNMEIKVKSAENVRVQVEIEEHENDENFNNGSTIHHSQEHIGLREESKNRLKRLGKLYAGGDEAEISSPIHRTEAQFYKSVNKEDSEDEEIKKNDRGAKGLKKLADLANTINQWEDDLSHPTLPVKKTTPKRAWKPPAPQPPINKPASSPPKTTIKSVKGRAPSPPNTKAAGIKENVTVSNTKVENKPKILSGSPKKTTPNNTKMSSETGAIPKQISWDPKVLNTLESQGFTRTTSSSRLVYAYNSQARKEQQNEIPKSHAPSKGLPRLEEERLNKKTDLMKKNFEKENTDTKKEFKSGSVANRAAIFEQKANNPVNSKPEKDPAMLSLAERKALFEKNKGDALIPKAAFGMSAPVKVDTMKAPDNKFIGINTKSERAVEKVKKPHHTMMTQETTSTREEAIQNRNGAVLASISANKVANKCESKVIPTVAVVHQAGGIANKMAALLENKTTISEEQIVNKMKEERQKELDMLLNRFNKNKEVTNQQDDIETVYSDTYSESDDEDDDDEETAMLKNKSATVIGQTPRRSAEKRKSGGRIASDSDSPNVVSVLEDVKRIRVSPPKAGKLYPNLSDIEATTTDPETNSPTPNQENSLEENSFDSTDPNTSFGRDILEAVCKNVTPTRKISYPTSSENSSVMDELDEFLDEEDENSSVGPTPPKHGRHNSPKHTRPQPSNSFHYKSFNSSSTSKSKFQSPKVIDSPRQSLDLPVIVDGEEILTLKHTVSVYRKQQNEIHTPVRQISRQPAIEESSETESCSNDEVEEKIKRLEDEVNKQQNIIAQTSQALNLCSATPEFSGSTEQVEAERVLLVASNRRQAALLEQQRLKVEGTVRPISKISQSVPLEKGTLTISNIVLPMKIKYVTALAATGGKGHHVVCLIKCGEQVVPTKLVSTVASKSKNPDTDLYIPGPVTLQNIYSDFTVTFEVYCLQAQEEFLPHEVKYHINKKTSKNLGTPKKNKQDSRLFRPPKESPGGPQVVRSSSFALMGYVIFSVQALNKKVWSLNNTPSMSPLEGSVEMKITCDLAVSVEHKGFLTMFEDISGFGAWHRRWCVLKGHTLSYWKYPDDEKKTAPIDSLDLKACITKEVKPVSREICARLHTFLLERQRDASAADKDTLVILRKGDKTIIRHLLSADTKEERIEWCHKINAALTAIRMWGNN